MTNQPFTYVLVIDEDDGEGQVSVHQTPVVPARTLTAAEQSAACKIEDDLLTLIADSVVARYRGEIEVLGEGKHGEVFFVPVDTGDIRDLLTELWGDLASPVLLDKALDELTAEGAENWPQGCVAPDEDELFSKAMDEDYDRECEEEHKKRLREQGT